MERAASDLYAPPLVVFRRITLPLLWPGIMAGAMLAFVISLDDVIITDPVSEEALLSTTKSSWSYSWGCVRLAPISIRPLMFMNLYKDFNTDSTVSPITDGFFAIVIPAAWRISTLSAADSPFELTIAPA